MKPMFVSQNRVPVRRIAAPPPAGVPPPLWVGGCVCTRVGGVPAYAGMGRDVLWE